MSFVVNHHPPLIHSVFYIVYKTHCEFGIIPGGVWCIKMGGVMGCINGRCKKAASLIGLKGKK